VPAAHRFAVARGRAPGAPPSAALKYARAESSELVTVTNTDAEVLAFSGYPDSIILAAQAFGVIFTLQDFMQREITEILVPAGNVVETYQRARRVMARNAVTDSVGLAMATGQWAELYEAE
jgi:hypothetical protein